MAAGNGVCNTLYLGDPAVDLTYQGWDVFQRYAANGVALATSQVNNLNNFQTDWITWDASFNADGSLSGFVRPTRPVLTPITTVDLSGSVPDAPTFSLNPIVLDTAPAEPSALSNFPELDLSVNGPDSIGADRPGSAPELVIPDAPTEPGLNSYDSPVLATIDDVATPEIDIVAFAELAPEFDAPPPNEVIDFVEEPYVSQLLDGIKSRITAMLAGQGLPPEVEDQLYSRLVDREEDSARGLLQAINEDFASRGFEAEPNGMLARRRTEVRVENARKRAGHNRDVYIQAQTVAVENVRLAVSSGIQLEGTLIQAHMQVEQRKFDLAVKTKDVAIAVFNAYVSSFNAQVQAFNARIAAYQAYNDGQKVRAEIYRTQVEAAKLKGDMNLQLVQIYEAQNKAELAKVEVYKAQIDGFRARIDAARAKLDGYRGEVDAYRAFVEAYKTEWDAERVRIEAQVQRGEIYKTIASVYASRVGVWQTKGEAKIQENRAQLASIQAFMQQHEGQIRAVLARLEASKTNLQAQVAQQDAAVRVYQIDAGVESTAVDADTRVYQAQSDRENQRLQIRLKDAELQITQLNQRANLLLRAMESASNASSQLAASAMSAVNFSAGVSSSASRGESCSTAFSYSGEIADA